MRKIYIYLFSLFCMFAMHGQAQNCEVPLAVLVPEQTEGVPESTQQYLRDKLMQIATQNGITSNLNYSQFVLSAQTRLVSKDVLPGPPMKVSLTMSVTLYIIDCFDDKVIATENLEVKSVDVNENKACISCIRSIHPKNREIQEFIRNGKEKIVNYYNTHYPAIIKKATHLAGMKDYEQAIFCLTSIPGCSSGYDAAIEACGGIYKEYVDDCCQQNLSQAKAVWMAAQNVQGAQEAGKYLSVIYPDAACYRDAMALYKEIKNKIKDKMEEDWDFEMKQYDDNVSLQKQRLDTYKEIGVAYGNGQKPVTSNIGRLF